MPERFRLPHRHVSATSSARQVGSSLWLHDSTATLEPPQLPHAPQPALQADEPPRGWRTRTKVLIGVGAVAVMAGGVVVLDFVSDQSHHSSRRFAGTVNVVDVSGISGDADVSINGGDAHLQITSSPHSVKARVNGGKIDVALPDDRTEYHVKARAEGGSTHVDVAPIPPRTSSSM